MPRSETEIDQLIEDGLGRYGEGDLDGALELWEQVLAIDPGNAPASSYVDYVRMNYEVLSGEGNAEHGGPLGLADDDPDYQIEVAPAVASDPAIPIGEPAGAAAGAGLAGPAGAASGAGRGPAAVGPPAARPQTVELIADEPPAARPPPTFPAGEPGDGVSFDDATREYPGGAGRPAIALLVDGRTSHDSGEFVPEVTPPFGSSGDYSTPQGFASEPTDVRRRDLGFVHPTGAPRRAELRTGRPAVDPGTAELKITVRTPGAAPDQHRAPTADGEAEPTAPPGEAGLALDLIAPPELELGSAYASIDLELPPPSDPAIALDLVGRAETRDALADPIGGETVRVPSLQAAPSRPPQVLRAVDVDDENDDSMKTRERPLPASSVGVATAPTQELVFPAPPPGPREPPPPGLTSRLPPGPASAAMIYAPTRELGLRGAARAQTEDELTGEIDTQTVRVPARSKPELPGLDPIDARTADILDSVDVGAPASETREDRTRRRITALLDRATAWSSVDLERAVTAVDLALSEDPNSALAQKLIHRNRETIMTAFQAYLGDLQRAPQLARPLHELASAPISPRAAFLLSRVDGTLSLDEILDVSGMPRLEAYRYLCQLFVRGILR